MEKFNNKFNNIIKSENINQLEKKTNNFEKFNNLLNSNIDKQYNKPWKELLKDCKIKKVNDYLNKLSLTNSINIELVKKKINYLSVEYDQDNMNIINIHNLEINDDGIINITNLKKTYIKKMNKKNEKELVEDI